MRLRGRSLEGRVVAITGGTRGIGRATAAALVQAGAKVAISGTDHEQACRVAKELGEDVRGYPLDVSSRPSFASFLDAVERDLGPLDVLVNNAGIMPVGPFLQESDAMATRQVDVNLHGMIFGMKEALPRMLERGSGHIVTVSSIIGRGGFPHVATYCATKHAIIGLTDAIRIELWDTPIDFSCVMPAQVNTDMASGLKPGTGVRKFEPEEVADAIVAILRRPRFEVYVPRWIGPMGKFMILLPDRVRVALGRFFEADQIMVRADRKSRADYERHIAPGAVSAPRQEGELPAEEELDRVDV
jgi:NAD(P)-dependent dehydrogenase (short-subunit alcohol dehydrogenase family)